MSDKKFTCAHCGETFGKSWSDEEAMAESKQMFGDVPPEDLNVICDGCFNDLREWLAASELVAEYGPKLKG